MILEEVFTFIDILQKEIKTNLIRFVDFLYYGGFWERCTFEEGDFEYFIYALNYTNTGVEIYLQERGHDSDNDIWHLNTLFKDKKSNFEKEFLTLTLEDISDIKGYFDRLIEEVEVDRLECKQGEDVQERKILEQKIRVASLEVESLEKEYKSKYGKDYFVGKDICV